METLPPFPPLLFFFCVKSDLSTFFFGGVNNFMMQSVHCLHFLPWKITLEVVEVTTSKVMPRNEPFSPQVGDPMVSKKKGRSFPMNVQQNLLVESKATKSEAFEFPKDYARQLLVSAVLGS